VTLLFFVWTHIWYAAPGGFVLSTALHREASCRRRWTELNTERQIIDTGNSRWQSAVVVISACLLLISHASSLSVRMTQGMLVLWRLSCRPLRYRPSRVVAKATYAGCLQRNEAATSDIQNSTWKNITCVKRGGGPDPATPPLDPPLTYGAPFSYSWWMWPTNQRHHDMVCRSVSLSL